MNQLLITLTHSHLSVAQVMHSQPRRLKSTEPDIYDDAFFLLHKYKHSTISMAIHLKNSSNAEFM